MRTITFGNMVSPQLGNVSQAKNLEIQRPSANSGQLPALGDAQQANPVIPSGAENLSFGRKINFLA